MHKIALSLLPISLFLVRKYQYTYTSTLRLFFQLSKSLLWMNHYPYFLNSNAAEESKTYMWNIWKELTTVIWTSHDLLKDLELRWGQILCHVTLV